jgi:hypothetical protein
MSNQWKQLSTERQTSGAREIERLPAAAALGFKVDITVKNLGHVQGSLIDFNAKSLAVDVTALAGIGQLESQIEEITVTHGTRDVRRIEKPHISIRQEEGQWRLIVLLNQMERQATERRHTRIKTRENFKPFLWVADPLHVGRVINFQVENFSADGLQLRTSLSNKHIIVGSMLENCQLLLPGIGTLTMHLVVCNAFSKDKHLVFGCLFQSINKLVLEMLAQYAILGGDDLPPHISQRKELLRAAGLTTRSLSKPCTMKVAETRQELEQILEVRCVAYKAAAKTPQGVTSAMMQDEYDASSIIYCAKYGPDVIATMRVNMSKHDGPKFPFETYFGSCESLGIVRDKCCEISRLAFLPEFQGSDLFIGLGKVIVQMLVKLGLDEMFCVATNKLAPMYQKVGAERVSDPVRHPVLENEFLTLYRIKTASLLTGSNIKFEVWRKISEEAINHLIYHGFLGSADTQEQTRWGGAVRANLPSEPTGSHGEPLAPGIISACEPANSDVRKRRGGYVQATTARRLHILHTGEG